MDSPAQSDTGSTASVLAGAIWRKSSYSGAHGNCVEVALNLPGVVAVRDSEDPGGPELVFTANEWLAFVDAVRSGELSP